MRLSTLLGSCLLLVGTTPAYAGGVGLVGTGGLHTAKAYYYDAANEQGIDSQVRPNAGLALEGIFGASDDRIVGLMRVSVLSDAPVAEPDIGDLNPDEVTTPPYADQPWTQTGVMTVGVQWGLYGDPEALQLVLATSVGTGFMTKNSTEYLLAEVGPGVTWNMSEKVQLVGNLTGMARYRKGFSFGGNAYAGVRFLFD